MRLRSALVSALAVGAVGAALASTATAAPAPAATAPDGVTNRQAVCPEKDLEVRAEPGSRRNVVRLDVVNRGDRTCVVDRIPTVTFRGLDGSAQPVPPSESGPYALARGERTYAAMRTADPGAVEGHVVRSLSVAADPSHRGVTFSASLVGMPDGIHVWEPVTTLWQRSRAAADRALADATD
ncbi:DUF4232 domain-containing protein [Streptomyces sp. NPDC014622]|uniref:DUF4232 domain-containing protein n=1 Tax=Streptomyces sp. NPDC014622 TaxID=3364874 RepID=UPI0036FD3682